MSAGNLTSSARARSLASRAKALELRKLGLSYARIAEQLGCSRPTAYRYVRDSLDELADECAETAEEIRRIEAERLDAMLLGLAQGVRSGDPSAVHAAIRVSESRRKLFGVDAERSGGTTVNVGVAVQAAGPNGQPTHPLVLMMVEDAEGVGAALSYQEGLRHTLARWQQRRALATGVHRAGLGEEESSNETRASHRGGSPP